jgi:hypothetical protein
MNISGLQSQIDALIGLATTGEQSVAGASHVLQGTLSVMAILYGPDSRQSKRLLESVQQHRQNYPEGSDAILNTKAECKGALTNMKAELASGLLGTLEGSIAGGVLSDMIRLAKSVLDEPGDGAKNVAAVLIAAAFEDTMRRLATLSQVPTADKLADVLVGLKDHDVLQGAQVAIAQSYLPFRNKALHAKWTEIDRSAVQSAIGFTEQILIKHLS